jgi:chemotaxis protein methyltransferase CheR
MPAVDLEAQLRPPEFRRLQQLLEQSSGIFVASPALLIQRLARRLRDLSLESFAEYCERVESDSAERVQMIEQMCTHETRFFRQARQFRFLEETLCPFWIAEADAARRPRTVRVWSAGCATGEEPYSIAMVLRARLPLWQVEVLATDVSSVALARTREATWPVSRARDIPPLHLQRFMLQGTGDKHGRMRATEELRALVRAEPLNLVDPHYALRGPFDAIFCRNVLMYFRDDVRARVVARVLGHLAPRGRLFLGHSEGLAAQQRSVRTVGPIVYAHVGEPA